MTESKIYFKDYYQKNREKILLRVKSNYYKHKFSKSQPQDIKKETIIEKGPIIVSFD